MSSIQFAIATEFAGDTTFVMITRFNEEDPMMSSAVMDPDTILVVASTDRDVTEEQLLAAGRELVAKHGGKRSQVVTFESVKDLLLANEDFSRFENTDVTPEGTSESDRREASLKALLEIDQPETDEPLFDGYRGLTELLASLLKRHARVVEPNSVDISFELGVCASSTSIDYRGERYHLTVANTSE